MKSNTIDHKATIVNVIVWTFAYLAICGIIPTAINMMIWRKIDSNASTWFNLFTLILFNSMFLVSLIKKYELKIDFFYNVTVAHILLAICCSIMFYFLLDRLFDPFFDSIFPTSADEYQETLEALKQAPVANFIHTCLLAPVVEESFMRGYVLSVLRNKYGVITALLVSAVLFAALHFNFVQTLSAVVCGLVLGLLYLKTNSLFCCILAHALYNTISFFTAVVG